MLRVAEGEQERDRDRLWCERVDHGDHTGDLSVAERLEHTRRSHALRDAHDVGPGHERRRMIAGEVVQRRAVLASQPQQVFETAGGDEHHACAAPFQ